MRRRDLAETRLPIVTASRFSATFLVSLCPRVAVAENRSGWPGNYNNLGYEACKMPRLRLGSLNPKRR